jgi:hypothetical protein
MRIDQFKYRLLSKLADTVERAIALSDPEDAGHVHIQRIGRDDPIDIAMGDTRDRFAALASAWRYPGRAHACLANTPRRGSAPQPAAPSTGGTTRGKPMRSRRRCASRTRRSPSRGSHRRSRWGKPYRAQGSTRPGYSVASDCCRSLNRLRRESLGERMRLLNTVLRKPHIQRSIASASRSRSGSGWRNSQTFVSRSIGSTRRQKE